MPKSKKTKIFVILTIIFKVTVNATLPIYYIIDDAYIISVAYGVFNLMLIGLIIMESIEYLKHFIGIAIIIDQLYSVIINIIFSIPIPHLEMTYPSIAMMYYIGAETFVGYKYVLMSVVIFSIVFLGHMIYKLKDNQNLPANYIISLFCFQIAFMFYKTTIK